MSIQNLQQKNGTLLTVNQRETIKFLRKSF